MWLLLYKIGDEQTGSLGGLGKLGEVLPEELELSFNLEIGYPFKKCIQLCFGYVIEFLMLIREMAFIFHKSKEAKTRETLKKLSKTIN